MIVRTFVLTLFLAALMPLLPALPADDVASTPTPNLSRSKPIRAGFLLIERGIGGSVMIVRKDSDGIVCPVSAHSEGNCYEACSHKLMSHWKCATVNQPKPAPLVVPISMAKQ